MGAIGSPFLVFARAGSMQAAAKVLGVLIFVSLR
jgi:hypothetical protein